MCSWGGCGDVWVALYPSPQKVTDCRGYWLLKSQGLLSGLKRNVVRSTYSISLSSGNYAKLWFLTWQSHFNNAILTWWKHTIIQKSDGWSCSWNTHFINTGILRTICQGLGMSISRRFSRPCWIESFLSSWLFHFSNKNMQLTVTDKTPLSFA